MEHPLISIGHRGAAGHAPENTLLAVEKGIELGADWIEIDVYAVEDELIVFHDVFLERTTNGSGFVMDQSLSYLRSLDAGSGERIPYLREVFERVDQRARINIELKGPATAAPVAAVIQAYVAQGWPYTQFIVSSFDHRELQKIQSIDSQIPIGILVYGAPLYFLQFSKALSAISVHLSGDFLDPALVNAAKKQGLKVFVYTINRESDLRRLQHLQIDGVFSDFPEIVTQFNRRRK